MVNTKAVYVVSKLVDGRMYIIGVFPTLPLALKCAENTMGGHDRLGAVEVVRWVGYDETTLRRWERKDWELILENEP